MTGKSQQLYQGGICLITDKDSCSLTVLEMAYIALRSGIKWIQYRDKGSDRLDAYRVALALRELTRDFGACLIINDYADIAAAVGADGVHLGQDDLPADEARKVVGRAKIVGISTHSREEALRAQTEGADYIGFGPVFPTITKDAGQPQGVGRLREISSSVRIPVVAIGGISPDNCTSLFDCGVSAVAAASSVLSGDIQHNASCLVNIVGRCSRGA
jgi:thiamine-phosphate pyrophosphorylase